MAKTYPVKWYNDEMQGAGQTTSNDSAGQMIAILKACLVDGFGALTPDTIVWDATESLAKATFAVGHSYLKDSVIACSGATPTDYNGEHRILKITQTEIWFELDTVPTGDATGTLEIKIAPLGWTITQNNGTNDKLIFEAAGDLGNVSLMVDNTAYTGWNGGNDFGRLMKVAMVENVVDINTYDTILEKCWPANGYHSDNHKWDLVGDSRIIFLLPEYGEGNEQACFTAGYIDSIRGGDRYHFIINYLNDSDSSSMGNYWGQTYNSYHYYTYFAKNFTTSNQTIARKYHQLEGTTGWMKSGLSTHNSDTMLSPNPTDNGFYINNEKAMIFESDKSLRGYLPILVAPLSNHGAYLRKNLHNLPEFPNKIFRMLKSTYEKRSDYSDVLIGFDISTVEV